MQGNAAKDENPINYGILYSEKDYYFPDLEDDGEHYEWPVSRNFCEGDYDPIRIDKQDPVMEERVAYRELVMENIGYRDLIKDQPMQKDNSSEGCQYLCGTVRAVPAGQKTSSEKTRAVAG